MTFWQKVKLVTSGFAGIFESQEMSEEKLEELKQKDVLSEMMGELGKSMPVLKRVLIDERDQYLTQKMKEAKGKKIVSVVGAGHVNGIVESLKKNTSIDLKNIEIVPPASPVWKIIGWGIPAIIVGSVFYIGLSQGFMAAKYNILYWILANGIPCAIGSMIALAHPWTIIASFIAAPITSLTPLIGAGYVAAFIQAYFVPPVVKEIQNVTDDVRIFKRWWQNKLLRIILVFILSGLGSAIGTYVGAYEIITNLFG
jgi:pheromone shutdown-related protein TraB